MPLINKQAKTNPNSWKDKNQKSVCEKAAVCEQNRMELGTRLLGSVQTDLQERNNQCRHDHPLDVLLQKFNHGVMATLKHQTGESLI